VVASARGRVENQTNWELGYHRIVHSHDAMNTHNLCLELDELCGDPRQAPLKEYGVKPFVALLVWISKTCGGELCSL